MPGAARLAGEAALRTGAGLVTVATDAASVAPIIAGRPELICNAVKSAAEAGKAGECRECGRHRPRPRAQPQRTRFLRDRGGSGKAIVLDADALTLLAEKLRRRDDWILTPHPGEAARLLATDVAAIQRDRLGSAREIATRYGGVCVLKGAGSLVATKDSLPWVCDRGNPGMATAGCRRCTDRNHRGAGRRRLRSSNARRPAGVLAACTRRAIGRHASGERGLRRRPT